MTSKVSTNGEIDVQHHDKLRAGEQAGSIAPCVQLAGEWGQNEVYVNETGHAWDRRIQIVKRIEHNTGIAWYHVNSGGYGTYTYYSTRKSPKATVIVPLYRLASSPNTLNRLKVTTVVRVISSFSKVAEPL